MFKNYLKIAWRNLLRHKLFSFINVVGLSIGITAAIIIGVLIYYELSFDRSFPNRDKLYRAVTHWETKQGDFQNRGVTIPLMTAFKEGIPAVDAMAGFFSADFFRVENPLTGHKFEQIENAIFTDTDYFQLFEYKWLAGSPLRALSEPGQVVLTQSRANIYFGKASPGQVLGQTLVYNDSIPLTVTGIVADLAEPTDFRFSEFISTRSANMFGMDYLTKGEDWANTSSANQLFFRIGDKKRLAAIEGRLEALADEHQDKQALAEGTKRTFGVQPFSDLHLDKRYGVFDNTEHQADPIVMKGLAFLAVFLLLLGCINFINLNTARSLIRSREIGIRKTLGSSKRQLVLQFLGEAFLLTLLATILSLMLAPLLLHQFIDFVPQGVNLSLLRTPQGMLGTAVLILLVSLLAGGYPAYVLSKPRPALVLRGEMVSGTKGVALRRGLSVFQFVIAQLFIIVTLMVSKQLYFLSNKDMGFKTKAVAYLAFPYQEKSLTKKERLYNQLKALPQVENLSMGAKPPASTSMRATTYTVFNKDKELRIQTEILNGDLNYLKVYDIPLIAGRERLNDSIKEYIANETLVRAMGFTKPEDAVGTMLKMDTMKFPIVGVMRDFYQRSLNTAIKPLVLTGDPEKKSSWPAFNMLHFTMGSDSQKWPATFRKIEDAFALVYPDEKVKINFMDQTVQDFYQNERRMATLLRWATGFAIVISCLGLLGLVVFTTQRRVKEIGIRKVLGASLAELNQLLVKEFLWLVGIAFLIAAPLAWFFLRQWLQFYANKTELSWWVFVAGGAGMLFVALFTIAGQVIKTARSNPVESLRNE